jgi:hypothetical protein
MTKPSQDSPVTHADEAANYSSQPGSNLVVIVQMLNVIFRKVELPSKFVPGEGINWWRDVLEEEEMQERTMLLASTHHDTSHHNELSGPGLDHDSDRSAL